MIIAKKIKLLCTIIIMTIVFLVTILYNQNSAYVNPIEQIDKTQEEAENKIDSSEKNEKTSDDEVFLHVDKNKVNKTKPDVNIDETQTELTEEISSNKENIIGNDLSIEHPPENSGTFVIINSVGYEKFTLDKEYANVYVESVNYYAENLSDDIKIYNLLIPTSSEFNIPSEYRNLSGSQKDGINYAYSNINEKIITVDAYSNLEENKDEYLYFKTDHHWTALGAYRAYESFMETKGEEAISLEKYKKVDSKNKYLGSIYSMTSNERLENNLDDIWYYKPFLSVSYSCVNRDKTKWSANQIIFPSYFEGERKYAAFMGGDMALSHISVDSNGDKKILVVKDSYGNAFIPFLLPHYKDIYVTDPRYFSDNVFRFIEENEIDEVLIINYASVLQLPGFSRMLKNMGTADVTSSTAINSQLP